MIEYGKLQAPRSHLGVLLEPPAERMLADGSDDSDARLKRAVLLNTTIAELRRSLRARLGVIGPVIVSGHQAEFFHAGVFAKTLMADALARQLGGSALFLTVDSDTPKTLKLIAPRLDVSPPQRLALDIPGLEMNLPLEAQAPVPRDAWAALFREARALTDPHEESWLAPFAEAWLASGAVSSFVAGVVRGHIAVEAGLCLRVEHCRMSALSETPEFRAFAAEIACRAPAFVEAYNTAQLDYRKLHRVRNAARPAPPLLARNGVCESPFWVFQPGKPRTRLFVRADVQRVEFFADRELIGVEDRLAFQRASRHVDPWELECNGWRLRPRALTLSAFVRYFLADLFIHGIGGAKYDEMTDTFAASFFGVAAPPIAAVSASLMLQSQRDMATIDRIREARHALRDARHNPQRRLSGLPLERVLERQAAVDRSVRLAREERENREARRAAWTRIRELNAELLGAGDGSIAKLERNVSQAEVAVRDAHALTDREYFYAFHRQDALRALRDMLRDSFRH